MHKARIILLAALFLAGCAARQVHPGAANSFDSSSYDALLVSHSAIESCKADLAAGKFPAAMAPKIKQALNDMIQAYDVADTAYRTYHAAAIAGQATPDQATSLSNAIQGINNTTAALNAAKGGK